VALIILLAPSVGLAMDLAGVGPRVGAVDPDGMNGTFAVGAHLDFQEAGSRVHLVPNLMFWDESGLSDVNPNLDMMYHFNPAGTVSPYMGAGVGIHFYSSEGPGNPGTDPSANFFGGLLFPSRAMSFFVEGRAVVADRDQFGVLTGVTLPVAR
jgi:hypothetical protein